jgi:hypothetical protein
VLVANFWITLSSSEEEEEEAPSHELDDDESSICVGLFIDVTAISNKMKKATLVMEKICEYDKEKSKLDKCGHIIQLAKHLGEDDMLRTLLADLALGRRP